MSLPRILAARQRRRLLARLVLNGAAQAAVAIIAALLARKALTAASGSPAGSGLDASIVEIGLALCVAAASLFTLRVAERADAERLGQHYVTRVRMLFFEHVVAGALHGHGRQSYGLTMTRLVTDLSALRNWVSSGLARLVVGTLSLVGVFVALTLVSPVASAAAGFTLSIFLIAIVFTTRPLKDRVREMRHRRGLLAANLGEKVLAAGTIQQFGQTLRERQRVRRQGRRLAHAAVQRATSAAVLRSLSDITLPLTAAAILVISNVASGASLDPAGAHLGASGWTAILFLLGMLQGSLRDLARACTHRLAFEQGRARLEEIMTAPIPRDSFVARDLDGDGPLEIVFEDVCAGNTLGGFDGSVRPGDSVAIQGPSGSGKSTVLALAARMREADAGLVYLGDHPVSHWTIASIRQAVTLVSPDVPLLASTVIDNIEYGSGPLAERQRAELLRLTGVSAAVAALPDGLETRVNEGGRNMPEGICARIRLARALACAPRVLLVDDPVFSSDGDARAALTRVIATRRATVLIATPSRALGIRTDRVWRIEQGRLAEVTPGAKVIPLSQVL